MANNIKNPKTCTCCKKTYKIDDFYTTKSYLYASNDFKFPVCKSCVKNSYQSYLDVFDDKKFAFRQVCRDVGWYYDEKLYVEHSIGMCPDPIGTYAKRQTCGNCKKNSYLLNLQEEFNSIKQQEIDAVQAIAEAEKEKNKQKTIKKVKGISEKDKTINKDYEKNKLSVIRSIGYDPFIDELEDDKALLYWMLENHLDEGTIEDPFKLACVVQIVKGFGHMEYLNKKISDWLFEGGTPQELTALSNARSNLSEKLLKMAKENGISVANNLDKSKGAGTLSGKIKELQEIGLEEIFVNLYDVETSQSLREVAELSSEAIYSKLRLDENEYTNIITEQRRMIEQLTKKASEIEEEFRLARVKLAKIESGELSGGDKK